LAVHVIAGEGRLVLAVERYQHLLRLTFAGFPGGDLAQYSPFCTNP
jgi:hypothetical protein